MIHTNRCSQLINATAKNMTFVYLLLLSILKNTVTTVTWLAQLKTHPTLGEVGKVGRSFFETSCYILAPQKVKQCRIGSII